jgi:hypothetical protein
LKTAVETNNVTDEPVTTPESSVPNTPTEPETPPAEPPRNAAPPPPPPPSTPDEDTFEERLERLGGEPAPVITPEEFARLQKAGQVHIDARGRVRTARRSDAEAGVSLRKRRAWYAQ